MGDDKQEYWQKEWAELPTPLRKELVEVAESRLWWKGFSSRFRGLGPWAAVLLSLLALWQVLGESVRRWLENGS